MAIEGLSMESEWKLLKRRNANSVPDILWSTQEATQHLTKLACITVYGQSCGQSVSLLVSQVLTQTSDQLSDSG